MKKRIKLTVKYCIVCGRMFNLQNKLMRSDRLRYLIYLSAHGNITLSIAKFQCPICKQQEVIMRHENKLTRHHVIPRSRKGDSSYRNIAKVPHKEHDLYHQLFANKTPDEIVAYLNRTFWNNNYLIKLV